MLSKLLWLLARYAGALTETLCFVCRSALVVFRCLAVFIVERCILLLFGYSCAHLKVIFTIEVASIHFSELSDPARMLESV